VLLFLPKDQWNEDRNQRAAKVELFVKSVNSISLADLMISWPM
jgi:hypothetical protein